ncbi:Crp/Fnr family transcriptional regulator [Sphingomonas baiyangensis]|uniref:Crp/Fnr family transcriptional regulator n=1 Tax=Sphingomonas baiyangensis TaxID=2572576 RepID=A0A4U1L3S8_9SPHN|nr:Crp/Fnr family transcriptional regulator [Sphingomonas baiyangensis]TKD51557.1 Crp/Fnr family transcriptional regulator [Sphingomonas baiyangensis]
MIDKHLMRTRARHTITEEEEGSIRALVSETRQYEARKTFIHAGERLHHSTILLDGLMCRYKDLRNGQRQITELHIPGDFADLHSFSLKCLDHNIMTLTPCRVALVPHERLTALTYDQPHLTRVYWFSTNLDAAIHREWELSLGRRDAASRVAHLFCELQARLALVGLADETGYQLKLTQADLAECLGLTPVHINRSLRTLREEGLVTFRSGKVEIHNTSGLQKAAEFDPAFLYLHEVED